mmetsp:Transcript_29761/g.70051  ORF Transcript_29761/g.70051 Transcript_29761/m.70051 type:complete len:110 (-) Transcript_29761:789-1118(-)
MTTTTLVETQPRQGIPFLFSSRFPTKSGTQPRAGSSSPESPQEPTVDQSTNYTCTDDDSSQQHTREDDTGGAEHACGLFVSLSLAMSLAMSLTMFLTMFLTSLELSIQA